MDVLFVDDERPVLEQAKLFLEDLKDGLKVETSSSARDAINKIRMKRYDAVVSDYLMPEMDGLDFLEKLRNKGEEIPFVILTGRGGENIAMEALNEGADFYMTKMGDPKTQYEKLADSIEKVIKRKKAREELVGKLDLLFNNAPEGIIINDEYGNIIYANSYILGLLGYSEEDLFLMNMADLDLILSAESVEGYYWNKIEPGDRTYIYTTYSRNDMTNLDVKIKTTKLVEEGKTYVVNFIDELAGLSSRNKYKKFFEKVPDVGFILNKNGILEEINKSFCKITGLPKEELIGRDFLNLAKILSVENTAQLENSYQKFKEGEQIDPFVVKIKDSESKDRFIRIETEIITMNRDEKLFGSACDITERIEAEDREDFLHSLLTHDIKNKAQVLRGYLDLLEDTELSEDQKKLVSKATKAVNNGVNLVRKIDTLIKISEVEKEDIRLKPIIDSLVSEVESKALENDMEIELELEDIRVIGDSLLDDMFYNIIINSVIHSKGSKVKISSEEMDDYLKVIIEDDGKGISDELKEIIFKKNSRKGKHAGTGLGMYIANKIAESLEGDIEVKDSDMGGARFEVTLKKA